MTHRGFATAIIAFLFMLGSSYGSDYLIGSGDVLIVDVWGVSELNRTVLVRPDGKITVPAVGDVEVRGLSPSEAAAKLDKLLTVFIKKPITTITVDAARSHMLYIVGEGAEAKQIALTKETTLLKLLAMVGDLRGADLRKCFVLRDGQRVYENFQQLYLYGKVEQDFLLQGEDVVFIPGNYRNKVYVVGEVVNPRTLLHREGMTLLDAVLESGGFTEHADREGLRVVRKAGGQQVVSYSSLTQKDDTSVNVPLFPGDYIIIPVNHFINVTVVGAVLQPANVRHREGMKLLDAILAAGGFNEYAKTSNVKILRADGSRITVDLSDVMEGKDISSNIEIHPGDTVVVAESIF